MASYSMILKNNVLIIIRGDGQQNLQSLRDDNNSFRVAQLVEFYFLINKTKPSPDARHHQIYPVFLRLGISGWTRDRAIPSFRIDVSQHPPFHHDVMGR
jgi:hypothetical protein